MVHFSFNIDPGTIHICPMQEMFLSISGTGAFVYIVPKSRSSTSGPWDLNSEKNMNSSQWRGTIIF